jgi:hypothetical protein
MFCAVAKIIWTLILLAGQANNITELTIGTVRKENGDAEMCRSTSETYRRTSGYEE